MNKINTIEIIRKICDNNAKQLAGKTTPAKPGIFQDVS
jgi:hypothetical protein